jgi:hypothetical protein
MIASCDCNAKAKTEAWNPMIPDSRLCRQVFLQLYGLQVAEVSEIIMLVNLWWFSQQICYPASELSKVSQHAAYNCYPIVDHLLL